MSTGKKDWGEYNYISGLTDDEKTMVALVKASEAYKKDSDNIYKAFGLTFSQYNVLRVLNNSKEGKNSVTTTSKIMLVSSPNMTGLAKRLEKNGHIVRTQDPKDERITMLEITTKGKKVLTDIKRAHTKNIRNYLKNLSTKRKKGLLEDLKTVFANRR